VGDGAPVPPSARAGYGPAADSFTFIHRNPIGGRLARGFDASALTIGEHVIGDTSALDPGTRQGQALLAHEMTHVAQERSAPANVQREADGTTGADDQELQALHVEAAVLGASPVGPAAEAPELDLDELTSRVYRRIIHALLIEQERAAQVA
jgi:hypothetical protein